MSWQILAAIAAGLAVMGLVLWVGMRSRPTAAQQSGGEGANPADAPRPNMVSRAVSWTSMVCRGGYRGRTKSLHRTGGSVDVLITDPARPDSPVKSWVHQRSVTTMTLVAEKGLSAGTIAKVRPLQAPDNISWVEVEVLECNQHEMDWQIVCKFVKVPPYNILMLFG